MVLNEYKCGQMAITPLHIMTSSLNLYILLDYSQSFMKFNRLLTQLWLWTKQLILHLDNQRTITKDTIIKLHVQNQMVICIQYKFH